MKRCKILIVLFVVWVLSFGFASPVRAFCGFYVSKADARLYNRASQVAIARDGNRTILTMANDYQGNVKDFALVVPVPVVLQADQVRVGDPKIMARLDAFSAPRLVEYFDPDPCNPVQRRQLGGSRGASTRSPGSGIDRLRAKENLGVTVESRFTVGEYDILILSARESHGLETWLRRSGYRIPKGTHQLLQPYIRQQMKFFVAKVNLGTFERSKTQFLRPLMMAYESPKFMLPIRLGMTNGTGEQDLIVYVLSPKGQAEVTNYRTAKIPSGNTVPVFIKNEFGEFYKAMFQQAHKQQGRNAVWLEYAWDMGWCDPCAANPLTPEELRKAGVFWLGSQGQSGIAPGQRRPAIAPNVFMTRFHVRYSRDRFPQDLNFQATANRQNFQGRYVLRHPFKGALRCPAAKHYQRTVRDRQEKEVRTLAQLTGWKASEIRKKARLEPGQPASADPWWQSVW